MFAVGGAGFLWSLSPQQPDHRGAGPTERAASAPGVTPGPSPAGRRASDLAQATESAPEPAATGSAQRRLETARARLGELAGDPEAVGSVPMASAGALSTDAHEAHGPLAQMFAVAAAGAEVDERQRTGVGAPSGSPSAQGARVYQLWQRQLAQAMDSCMPPPLSGGLRPHQVELFMVHTPEQSLTDMQRYTVTEVLSAEPDRPLPETAAPCLDQLVGMGFDLPLPWSDTLPAVLHESFPIFLPAAPLADASGQAAP